MSVVLWTGAAGAQSIAITVAQNLSFPTIAIPDGGTTDLSVSPLNSSTSGSATVLYGVASRGQYGLSMDKAGSAISVSIDIIDVSVSDPHVTLSKFKGFYQGSLIDGFPSQTLAPPSVSPGNTPFYLGATISANSGVKPGTCSATFTIIVTIQ